jgi:hypothetical protein
VNFRPNGLYSLFLFVLIENTGEVTLVPWHQTMKAYRMRGVKVYASLISALDGGE